MERSEFWEGRGRGEPDFEGLFWQTRNDGQNWVRKRNSLLREKEKTKEKHEQQKNKRKEETNFEKCFHETKK